MKLLNIGCGKRYHPSWVNIDMMPQHKSVGKCDVRHGLEFEDASIDAVYHSHLLEHLEEEQAINFIKENYRILKPGGFLRVVVPDLEQMCRTYLEALEKALQGIQGWSDNHHWMVLEMYDQAVRNSSGGRMCHYLSNSPLSNKNFVISRCGTEVSEIIKLYEMEKVEAYNIEPIVKSKARLFSKKLRFKKVVRYFRESLIKYLLGREYEYLRTGRFRHSGEVHQWMYDRFSLTDLLKKCGFTEVRSCSATESSIADWEKYLLDTEPNGEIYKPDSLYIEGAKL